jgi:hypothetical protein
VKRLPDWQTRLADYIRDSRKKTHDALLFNCGIDVASAIHAQTGVQITAKHDPSQGSYLEFCRGVAAEYGLTEVPPLLARRGDPIGCEPEHDSGFDLALGICLGEQARFFHPSGEFRLKPISECSIGWRI